MDILQIWVFTWNVIIKNKEICIVGWACLALSDPSHCRPHEEIEQEGKGKKVQNIYKKTGKIRKIKQEKRAKEVLVH